MPPHTYGLTRRLEIKQLTGIRIVAALWVVTFHYRELFEGILPELRGTGVLTGAGYLAVDLFFVLSGFILAYQYMDRMQLSQRSLYAEFLWKRLARIYPVHITVLAMLAVMVFGLRSSGRDVNNPEAFTLEGMILDILLIRSWVGDSQGWNGPAWSLSAEWLAYVLFPVIAALALWLLTQPRSVWVLAVITLLCVSTIANAIHPSTNEMPLPVIRVLTAFISGCVIYLLVRDRKPSRSSGWLGVATLIMLISVPGLIDNYVIRGAVGVILAGGAVYFLAGGTGAGVRFLSTAPLQYGGRISFSLYVIHVPMLSVIERGLPLSIAQESSAMRLAVAVLILAIVLVGAAALYHFVEHPAQRFLVMRSPFNHTVGTQTETQTR